MLTPDGYKHRLIDATVDRMMRIYGAVCVEGPKWCGKTWTSRNHCVSASFLGDPAGNFMNKQLAEMDPSLILNGDQPRLIDEWQVVPSIWDAVRHKVDQTSQKGQYILTGSSTPAMKGMLHGGSGRIGRIPMMRIRRKISDPHAFQSGFLRHMVGIMAYFWLKIVEFMAF